MVDIIFTSLDRMRWIREISSHLDMFAKYNHKIDIRIIFDSALKSEDVNPVHLVTLACMIEYIARRNGHVSMDTKSDVANMIYEKLRFHEYWKGGKNYAETELGHIFNIWRIDDNKKEVYSKNVEEYFQRSMFKGKDLSPISITMNEAFYNVFDHAEADGNAFSCIQYEQETTKLMIAICDLGKGIARSVTDFDPSISSDVEALRRSIDIDFTVRSRDHNRGWGLSNILECAEWARIISNGAILIKSKGNDNIRVMKYDPCFNGTLVFVDMYLEKTEDIGVWDSYDLNF